MDPSEKIFGELVESRRGANPGIPLDERTIEDLREGTRSFVEDAGEPAPVSYMDRVVPVRDGASIPVRVFNEHLGEDSPVLIFYPGCAFVFDLFEVNSIICSRIALNAGIKVILVQFRLAPENPMPTSLYDGYDAAVYISTHADDFGIDPARIFLGGWCSGAHCAAAASSLARGNERLHVYHQILLSGGYDLLASNHGFDAYEQEDRVLHRSFTAHVAQKYYGISADDYKNPLLSPYYETDFRGLPPTSLLVSEYDALRNDTEGYFTVLKKGGVEVEKIVLTGQTHNTIALRKPLSDGLDPAVVIANVIVNKLTTSE